MKKQFLISALTAQLILGQFTLTVFAQRPATKPSQQPKPSQSEPQQRPSEEETVRITRFDKKTGWRTFHKLSLKVLRPGKFSVRMRNGFYGVADDEHNASAATPTQRIFNALTSPFGAAGVRLRLTTLFANDAKVGSYMRSRRANMCCR